MMSLVPAGLPAAVSFEPATAALSREVFEILEAELTAEFGFCPDTEEDVRAELEPPENAQTAQLLLRTRDDGAPAQWWAVLRDPGAENFHLWVRSHPRLPDDLADEMATVGFATMTDWIRTNAPAGSEKLQLRSGCPAGSGPGHRHLEAAGFTHRRTFWEMAGPVTETTRATPKVPGLSIGPPRDLRAVHRLCEDAFVGHYGYEPMGFDDWLAVEKSLSGYDPTLWYVAELEGSPVGVMLMSRRVETDGALYVGVLATAEPYRRRGIASALLNHAFDVAADKGFTKVSLHVDSENTNAAPSVYRRAGLDVRCAFHAYACEVARA